jgi:hypothetical protein
MFQKHFILEGLETWLPGNPNVNQYVLETIYHGMMNMYASNPDYTPTDMDVTYYSSETYDAAVASLAIDTTTAIIKAVVSDDPEKEWNSFLDANRAKLQPAADELTSKFGNK